MSVVGQSSRRAVWLGPVHSVVQRGRQEGSRHFRSTALRANYGSVAGVESGREGVVAARSVSEESSE